MNYNQIHPNNKKTKRLRLRNTFAYIYPKMSLITALGASQIVNTSSQASDRLAKQKVMFNTVLRTASAIIDIMDEPRQHKFKKTGWYGLKKGELAQRKERKRLEQEAYKISDDYYGSMMFSGSR